MNKLRNLLLALLVAIGVVSLVVALSPGGDPTGGVPVPPAPAVAPQQPTQSAAPPPAVGSPARPGGAITLAEAIAIAEKTGQGYATKAERRDKPQLCFRVEVMGVDGQKRRIELNADGTLKPGDDDR